MFRPPASPNLPPESGNPWRLPSCSRAGAMDVGMTFFESMRSRYGIEAGVEHYACVVDTLGRAGMVERAYEFIKRLPFHPTVSIWVSLLGSLLRDHTLNQLLQCPRDYH
ncbi:hypothetical protein L1987_48029 [Smallanthus sonchifolius]|uniref:Uncharacterized protein n=1 Tax=Smallanthus sonchifolius TaxID=185202 RepID=A0ACB9FQ76_9ASTR|nr:hypothetical protein L1987_48029 [Smallanthus sonchifolius]